MNCSDDIIISGRKAVAHSYAKINLTLDILNKRPDGYHNIETVMHTVNLSDTIIIYKYDRGIHLKTNKSYLPANDKNIAYAACKLFFKETGIKGGAKISLYKNIPVAAGLAGGSGNGAVVLSALNMLYSKPLSAEKLCEISVQLGADVPYCLTGGTQLAEGIGEILTPLKTVTKNYVLLVTPPINVSTASIYKEFDNTEKTIFPNSQKMIDAIEKEDFYGICENLSNTLESVTIKMHPVIGGIKQKMLNNGAIGAIMSGSGPTVFGFFDDYSKAKASHDSFALMYKDVYLLNM